MIQDHGQDHEAPPAPEIAPDPVFILASGPASGPASGLTVSQLATRWGCSPQTIDNYRARGMPSSTYLGVRRYDADAADAWRKDHVSDHLLRAGGKRAGAGRKPATSAAPRSTLLEPADPQPLHATNPDTASPARDPFAGITPYLLTAPGGLEKALKAIDEGGLVPAEVRRRQEIIQLAKQEIDYRALLHQLVDREEAEAAWGAVLNSLRIALETLADRAASTLGSSLGIDAQQQTSLHHKLDKMLRRELELIALDPLRELIK